MFNTWIKGSNGSVYLFVFNSSFGEYDGLKVFDSVERFIV